MRAAWLREGLGVNCLSGLAPVRRQMTCASINNVSGPAAAAKPAAEGAAAGQAAAAAAAAAAHLAAAPGPAASAAAAAASAPRMQMLAAADGPSALDGITTLILDCDGVLWRGMELMPHTAAALQAFRARGLRLIFLTNNSSKSRAAYMKKFSSLGLGVAEEELIPTSYTAAAYLCSIGFSKKAFVIGSEGLETELTAAGISYVTWNDVKHGTGMREGWESAAFEGMEIDRDIGAVVVGFDPGFCYSRLCYASACIHELEGCLFVATNPDQADRMGNGRMMPGTGCSVVALEAATQRQAHNVGKGGDWLLPFLCQQFGVRPEEACIVGDRLDTDIWTGRQGGLRTVLPLTGVTTVEVLEAADPSQLPDFVVPCLATLAGLE